MAGTLIKKMDFAGGRQFMVVVYDLLYEPADCIVNAANGGLSHGRGVTAAIEQAAGPRLTAEGDAIIKKQGRIPVGEAVVTTAGNLPFKGVIHAVGPRMGDGDEESKLVKTLRSAFLRAHERGWSSLEFPGISFGISSVPYQICTWAYVRAVREFFEEFADSPLKTIRLCLLKGPLLSAVEKELL